jgi:hypothetical protein
MRSIDRRPSGDAHARGCAPRTSGERFIQRSADGEGCAGDVARIGERHEVTRTPQFKALRRLPGNRRRLPRLAGRWAAWFTAALPFARGIDDVHGVGEAVQDRAELADLRIPVSR